MADAFTSSLYEIIDCTLFAPIKEKQKAKVIVHPIKF
jgi:hypothetical protein